MANRIKISKETGEEVRRVLAKARAEQKILRERQKQAQAKRFPKPRVRIGSDRRQKVK